MTMKIARSGLSFVIAIGLMRTSARAFVPRITRAGQIGSTTTSAFLFDKLFASSNTAASSSSSSTSQKLPVLADESVMSKKAHGTSATPVMKNLRWQCDYDTADRICNFNRHYAEYAGYWNSATSFLDDVQDASPDNPVQFYDSVTGALLFTAPVGRSWAEFVAESNKHGWPSFRDAETNWEHVRCLPNGECVSVTGTHLGHNLPDGRGNRYCINLVSVAGQPHE